MVRVRGRVDLIRVLRLRALALDPKDGWVFISNHGAVADRHPRAEGQRARRGAQKQNWPLERQLDFACAAAALNCTASGARGGIQSVEAIEELMATGIRHAPAHIHCTAASD